ncbi:uncharacterized protein KNAG_0A02990 [Huiozyma naganishii CBS 8797]|uniref:Uncharacterized protein n=1 Tax=Huiozyma naganishii (strain ATCC MYA-139 / BCRC 22969 / CBS 8797 / KCTC 17520 / NBRC 10181 / NCYC 3082 / Yp74L-3) TaxID=1071383 RepID=J7RTF5_HUIN7|nr:hypothetical protein KNAG_0A02990 [Kazachstania naganishii CBS 8797]CCK67987.1 hypothetical protein KNAG_0A02990 [Kazachstania naganishii CBS 8797]
MISNLIVVPCHSVWVQHIAIDGEENLGQSPEYWILANFQHEGNDHLAFIKHALRALEELLQNWDRSVLLFSGSQTKREVGPVSEAQSYFFLLWKIIKWAECQKKMPSEFDSQLLQLLESVCNLMAKRSISSDELFQSSKINTEEFSLDSFDNLLFSLCRFKEITNAYPTHITIVGFAFKQLRFLKYHAAAIDYPSDDITYIGIEPLPLGYSAERLSKYYSDIQRNENKNALNLFENDWYGQREVLLKKKQSRNPFQRYPGYETLKLLHWDKLLAHSDESHFREFIAGRMPWSR